MKILFVRHGNPNYKLDCLTELGHKQAKAVAERLSFEGIEKIYSSTCGRAFETASYTAEKYDFEVNPCDFMREIDWGSATGDPADCLHPWFYAADFVRNGKSITEFDQNTDIRYKNSKIIKSCDNLIAGFDNWLSELGFTREGNYYRVGEVKYEKVAMFCHGGAFATAVSHLFNLTMPFSLISFPLRQTGIAEIELLDTQGELVNPRFLRTNDVAHLEKCGIEITD